MIKYETVEKEVVVKKEERIKSFVCEYCGKEVVVPNVKFKRIIKSDLVNLDFDEDDVCWMCYEAYMKREIPYFINWPEISIKNAKIGNKK